MDLADLPDWVQRLPDWVRDDEVRWMTKRPWLAGFVRETDYSLDPAIERFEASQRRFRFVGERPSASELVSVRGLETTSLRYATTTGKGVTRHVKIESLDADRLKGLAVPYDGRPSHPVMVSGIIAVERFDRDSFAPLPPSVPLRIDHDPAQTLGRVTSLRHTKDGLAIEADITLNEHERRTWLHRWNRGEHSSLSIAFAGAAIFDDWATWHGLPLRTVRGARLFEVSAVRSPAYDTARITEVLAA